MRALVVSGATSCVVVEDGTVMCWGANDGNRTGKRVYGATPEVVPGLANVVDLAMGMHECALLRTGKVACWGSNQFGEVGARSTLAVPALDDHTDVSTPPALVAGIEGATAIALGGASSCARIWQRGGSLLGRDHREPLSGARLGDPGGGAAAVGALKSWRRTVPRHPSICLRHPAAPATERIFSTRAWARTLL